MKLSKQSKHKFCVKKLTILFLLKWLFLNMYCFPGRNKICYGNVRTMLSIRYITYKRQIFINRDISKGLTINNNLSVNILLIFCINFQKKIHMDFSQKVLIKSFQFFFLVSKYLVYYKEQLADWLDNFFQPRHSSGSVCSITLNLFA